MRKKIVAGNWKMNLNLEEAKALTKSVDLIPKGDVDVYVFPPSIYINSSVEQVKNILVGAQNGHPEKSGAFTGEVSMHQLASIGVKAVLVGHSERRSLFQEKDDFLKLKVDAALHEGLTVFLCCGETLEERKAEKHKAIVKKQIASALFHLSDEQWASVVVAYEPVWAIGTGETASAEQAEEMHAFIRTEISRTVSVEVAENISILYGGSCKSSNAKELFAQKNIDGGLIGGASLSLEDFSAIINAY